MIGMGLQVFGTRKCPETRKAERFLKERGIAYQFVDLAEKGISPGELHAVAAAAGIKALMDAEGAHYKEKGLGYMDYDLEEELLKDPLLLKTPILRDGKRAAVGFDPALWKAFIGA
jgi:arsenate reductase-like glutaredoxin family protein